MYNILVCDDEKDIRNALQIYLTAEGYHVLQAENGQAALDILRQNEVHLVLMDIMMPGLDGMATTTKLREAYNIPVILLTAKSEDMDKILGLTVGADDYITKPFSMRELLARVRANMRRAASMLPQQPGSDAYAIRAKDLVIDRARRSVSKNGKEIELTQREYELIKYLAENPGKVMSREELMAAVWQYDYFGDLRAVDVAVRRLREKIEPNPSEPQYVMTKRGAGYYFAD